MSWGLQSEDTDSDMSDAEGRGSVSEDESSMRPAARSKGLSGKCDLPDTQDSSEAVSHGGSKAGRGALPFNRQEGGEGWGGNSMFWRQCWQGTAVAVLFGSGKALSEAAGRGRQGGGLGRHCRGLLVQHQQGRQACAASTASASLVQASVHLQGGGLEAAGVRLAGNSAVAHFYLGHTIKEQGCQFNIGGIGQAALLGSTQARCQLTCGHAWSSPCKTAFW